MSERRRRSGGKKSTLVWLGWGVAVTLVLLLAGNIVLALVNQKDDAPQGFITLDLLLTVAFWTPVAAASVMSILGLYWANNAYAHSERSSLLWARRGYIFSLVGIVAFIVADFDPATFDRRWLAVVAVVLVCGQSVFFALLSFREFRRAAGEGSARRVRSGSAAPTLPPADASPGASPSAAESPSAGG